MIDRVRALFWRSVAKATSIQFLPDWVRDPFREYSLRQLVKDGYKNSAVYACIRVVAESFPEPELHVFEVTDDGERVQLVDHPMRQLLASPNPFMAEDEFWEYCITYAAVGGNFYVWKERNAFGIPVALWPFHDGLIAPVLHRTRWISHYELDVGTGTKVPIPVEDIIHWRWSVDPEHPQLGMSPIIAAARTIDMDTEYLRYALALAHNDAVPRTIIKTKLGFDDTKLKALKAQWKQRFGGGNRGDVAIINDTDAEIMRVGANLSELAVEAIHNIPESRIAAAYGGAPVGYLAGLNVHLQRSTFSNYDAAELALHRRVLSAKWRSVAASMTRHLLREFTEDPRLVLDFDTSHLPAMEALRREREAHAKDMYVAGVWSRNEARAATGRPALAEDVILESATQLPVPVVFADATKARLKAKGAPTRSGALALRRSLQGRRRLQRESEDAIADALQEMQEEVLGALEGRGNGRA